MVKFFPNFKEELILWKRGFRVVVGLDEAGRGPLAGPVVAAAVCFLCHSRPESVIPAKARPNDTVGQAGIQVEVNSNGNPGTNKSGFRLKAGMTKWEEIKDSKKLSPAQREEWYKVLIQHPDIKWGVGIVSEKIIDKINIFEATKLAMKKAFLALKISPEYLLLDGNFTIEDLAVNQKAVVRGDEKIFSCAAASIIAKVTRDRIMCRYAKKYPQYGFEKHKGYGTRRHLEAIKKHGPCDIHRRSFRPIKRG